MTLSSSLTAYRDCRELFESAADDASGARASIPSLDAGTHLRMRMNYFRKLDRQSNARTYPPEHPLHNTSIYDEFHITLREDTEGGWWIYVERRTATLGVIEKLSDVPVIDAEYEEIPQIEHAPYDEAND